MLLFDDPEIKANHSFATPDDGKSYSQRAREAFSVEKAQADFDAQNKQITANWSAMGKIASASWDQQIYIENSVAREDLLDTRNERVRSLVKREGGIDLENPVRMGYYSEAVANLRDRFGPGWNAEVRRNPTLQMEAQQEVFIKRLQEAIDSQPQLADRVGEAMVDFSPAIMAQRVKMSTDTAMSESPGLISGTAASIVGGIIPSFRDPVNAIGMVSGLGPARSATPALRLFETAIREGGINAVIAGGQQPLVQQTRRELGLEAGFAEGAQNVAMAFAFGSILGSGMQGASELVARVKAGTASAGDIAAALKAAKIDLDPEARVVLDQAVKAEADDRAIAATRPADIPPEIADDVLRQAVAYGEDPIRNPPPDLALVLPPPRPDRAAVINEASASVVGDVATVDGKPVAFARFSPAELTTDASAFQYKGGGDGAGITDRLRGVEQWDALAGGRVFVFERTDGSRVIADGHQRLGLAKRLSEEGQRGVELVGHLFRQEDGWTAQDVRALAAKKNMQEGSGSALDAARVLRDRPDLADGGLPATGPMMRNALSLSRLSDEAFAMVNAGVVPEAYGARVGAMVANPLEHQAVINDLIRFRPESEREASLLIGGAMRAEMALPDYIARANFDVWQRYSSLDTAASELRTYIADIAALRRDASLASASASIADQISTLQSTAANAKGKKLERLQKQISELEVQREAAEKIAPPGALTATQRQADARSELMAIDQQMRDLAVELSKARAAAEEARASDLRSRVSAAGLPESAHPALISTPELRPAHVAEPGTPQALAAAETVEIRDPFTVDMFGGDKAPEISAPAKADLGDMIPLPSRDDPNGTRLVSRETALAEAEQLGFAADLVKACKG